MTDSRDEHEPYGFTESPVIAKLQAEVARLTAERDEARREVCGLLVACHTDPDDEEPDRRYLKHVHAGIRGWDCFKENTND